MPKLLTASEYYDATEFLQDICECSQLSYNVTDGGADTAYDDEIWSVFIEHVLPAEPSLNQLLTHTMFDEITAHPQQVRFYSSQWDIVATALGRFVDSGGSERNFFTDPSECFDKDQG